MSAPNPIADGTPDRSRIGLDILGAALVLGVLTDLLLRAFPWGLNFTLSSAALVTAGALLVGRHRIPRSADAPWVALTVLLLAVAFVRRDAGMLQFLDVVGMLGALALATLSLQGVALRLRGVADFARAAAVSVASTCVGVLPLTLRDIRWADLPLGGRLRQVRAVGLGLLLALPLLLVFGGLFMAADATFEELVGGVFAIDVPSVTSHTMVIGVWTALAAGYFRGALLDRKKTLAEPAPSTLSLGIVPVGTALGLLNLLFLLFIAAQAPYLFSGAAVVEQTTGFTLAEFARRGFFELVTASALVLPVLLGADWAIRAAPPHETKSFRALAGLLLLQLGAVMGSALFRMRLYVAEFGFSQDRVYATAFMAYLGFVSVWFAWTCLRGKRRRFALGAALQGYAVLAALHLVNVDGLIVRANVARAARGASFDVPYHTRQLSADAVPALLAQLPRLGEVARYDVARGLLDRWTGPRRGDWRSWNWSVARARALVRREAGRLAAIRCVSHSQNGIAQCKLPLSASS